MDALPVEPVGVQRKSRSICRARRRAGAMAAPPLLPHRGHRGRHAPVVGLSGPRLRRCPSVRGPEQVPEPGRLGDGVTPQVFVTS